MGKYILPLLLLLLIIELGLFGFWIVRMDGWNKLSLLTSYVPQEWVVWDTSAVGYDLQLFSENITEVNNTIATSLQNIPETLARELQGSRFYLMLANKEGGYTRSFSFEDGAFKRSINELQSDLFYAYSQNGQKLVYLALPPGEKVDAGRNWGEFAQIFTADKSSVVAGFTPLENSLQRTATSLPYKQFPAISNAGNVLFNVGEHIAHKETESAEDFGVYHVSSDRTIKYLMQGFEPQWMSDTEFLVLKNDGLHKATVDGSASTLLIPKPSAQPVLKNQKFKLSPDGTKLVWTIPDEKKILIYSKTGNTFTLIKTIETKGLQPEFSPSGAFLAVYSVGDADVAQGGTLEPKIVFYDMSSYSRVEALQIPLDAFNPRAVFITEWVNK